jgi:ABC-2 type transport system permease protein
MHALSPTLTAAPDAGTPMALGRVARAYLAEVRYESLRMLRSPGFSVPFLAMPVPIYLFFGVLLAAPGIASRPGIANYLFCGFSVFAVMGPALFGVGCALAIERDAGLLKLKRAQPAPPGSYLVAKMLMGMVFAAGAMSTLLAAALIVGTVTLSGSQLAIITLVMVVGALPFCAMGLFVGAYASGSAAPAIANVIFLPMLWLSGLFIPLPKFLEPWVVIWPAFHLDQTALGAAGVSEFSFVAPQISAAVLVAVTVVCGGLAVRRLALKG